MQIRLIIYTHKWLDVQLTWFINMNGAGAALEALSENWLVA